ncbi:tetratricopeptide repeat protein [Lysobacter terrae]
MRAIRWVLVLLLGVSFAVAATGEKAKDAGEAAQLQRLTEAQQLIGNGRHDEAIALIDQTLDYYAKKYPEGRTRWYVTRTPEEDLLYLVGAAADADEGRHVHANATTLRVLWADAHYMKAYALYELNQLDAAKAELERALYLTPRNSQYLSELGNIHQTRHEWDLARSQYEAAEDAAEFSRKEERVRDLSRAKRGIGFVLIEQGDLDAAEAKFKQCLALDPDDRGAQNELEYIAQQRAKAAPQKTLR